MDLDDDSDDDDSDYKVDDGSVHEMSDDDDDKKKNLENKPIDEMSHKRKRIAEELWDEMNNTEKEDISKKMHKAITPFYQQKVFKNKVKLSKANNVKDMLNSIFGNSSKDLPSKVPKQSDEDVGGNKKEDSTIKDDIKRAVKGLKHQGKVIEKVKFAGQEIFVKVSGKEEENQATTKKSAATSSTLDSVLESLKGPKTISTVTKSSIDWDNYKEQEGLQDMLQVAAQDGYLTRKDFLNRCDVRAFENERDERDKIRAQTAPTAGGSSAI